MNPIQDDKYYSIDQLSKILSVYRTSLRTELIDRKLDGLPAEKIGNQFRILGKDFHDYAKRNIFKK